MIACIIILSVSVLWIWVCVYMLFRNNSVYKFRGKLIEATYRFNIDAINSRGKTIDWDFYPSYNSMMYSFKRLTLENWVIEEYMDKIEPYFED